MKLCLLCKEPFTTPLSVETVSRHIALWLPDRLVGEFRIFHSRIVGHLKEFCREDGQLMCTHCYVREAHQWLKGIDDQLAERLLEAFSFGYSRESFEKENIHIAEDSENTQNEFGICDECGEYSPELVRTGGEWLCRDCEQFG